MAMMEHCRACRSRRLHLFLPLGEHPAANAFLRRDQLERPEPRWPLDAYACLDCGLIQVANVLPPDFFRDYLYVPSAAETMHRHFDELAGFVRQHLAPGPEDLVVDIGSNDGLFLWKLKSAGGRGLGVEPAANLAAVARERGVEVVNEYFDSETAAAIRDRHGNARVITTTNTFNHIDDLHGFMSAVAMLLDQDGTFVVEVPHAADLIEHNEFDTIYHEHVSEFTVKSLVELFACFDLGVVDILRLPVHGGSMRVLGRRRSPEAGESVPVAEWIGRERAAALFDAATYEAFAMRVRQIRLRTLELLGGLKGDGRRIAGYGAPAKGNTLLNYYAIGPDTLDFLADRNALKHGLFSPGMHIPIVPAERVAQDQPDYLFVLAWNFGDEILRQQAEYRKKGGKVIMPIPEPVIVA
jgi:SAM-dependent methyltransferase